MNDLNKSDKSLDQKQIILDQIFQQEPYSLLTKNQRSYLFESSNLYRYGPGQLVLRPDEISKDIFLVINGKVRLLAKSQISGETVTLGLRGSGQLLGWVSLLRASPTEWIIASEESLLLSISARNFLKIFSESAEFASCFESLGNAHESFHVAETISSLKIQKTEDESDWVASSLERALVKTIKPGSKFAVNAEEKQYNWYISTELIDGFPVGSLLTSGNILPVNSRINVTYRLLGFPINARDLQNSNSNISGSDFLTPSEPEDFSGASLKQLGILEEEHLVDEQRYPVVMGRGPIQEALAVAEMVCLHQRTPFRKDILEKLLEDQLRRNKSLSIELVSRLCELMGLNCQLASIKTKYFSSIEAPSIVFLRDVPVVIFSAEIDHIVAVHPHRGIIKIDYSDAETNFGDICKIALPRRTGTTPTSRFGWNWFTPLIKKYKKALSLVFVASLLAQLFGLAVPLLIQQIIDKVLSQGNLSSLNVLGAVMVLLSLFQGILMALRTYIFVDTTDRMDLSLGSSVIDRLLALPLSFFEKRPVGELSQRLGELNTIRGFLTGTALVSVLNIIFALLYLIVMIIYSPLLTAVSLSTLPLYFLIVFGVAPIYKNLLRKRAVAQAKTQSHLIEVLGGIQTVKAQHFELTARWKWQDRYRDFVNNGFRSAVLGSTSGEVGKFLNQLSGLIVLWVGMWLVLEGQLTLGMLIAFRIISGNVTGPLLQLSGLYQGFQKVQISMERLSTLSIKIQNYHGQMT